MWSRCISLEAASRHRDTLSCSRLGRNLQCLSLASVSWVSALVSGLMPRAHSLVCQLHAPSEWWGAGVVICLERGADLHMAQLMPVPLTDSCFCKIQIGFTFLVPAHPGSPGKGPLNRCVCVFKCTQGEQVQQQQQRPFNGLWSGTTRVSRYQKSKTNLDFTEARDSEWQWHQLGHMQVCTLLQIDNHACTPPLRFLQAGCPSCHPTNSVKALKARKFI